MSKLNFIEEVICMQKSFYVIKQLLSFQFIFKNTCFLLLHVFSVFLYQNTCSHLNLLTICLYIVPQSSEITLSLKNVISWQQTWRVLNVIYTYLIYFVPSHISNFHRTDEIFCFIHLSQCFVNYMFKNIIRMYNLPTEKTVNSSQDNKVSKNVNAGIITNYKALAPKISQVQKVAYNLN